MPGEYISEVWLLSLLC